MYLFKIFTLSVGTITKNTKYMIADINSEYLIKVTIILGSKYINRYAHKTGVNNPYK